MNRGGSQMKRTSLKPTPMKRVSAQPNEYELEFRKMKPIVRKRSKYQCEAKTDVCIGGGQHVHHRKLRSQGGTNSEANLIDVCMPCHEWIHAHPALSYQRGWLLHGHDEETPLR
jgi:5-methylcytosine-specific restriction endonuclease McrA